MSLTYKQVLEEIYRLRRFGWKLGLERIEVLLGFLRHPERHFPAVQIGGSNGKGSVAAALDVILRAAGYRVGRYTSPHLVDFRERITVNGKQISGSEVVSFYRRIEPFLQHRQEQGDAITFFELATGMAFDHFARQRVDIAVVEVGLGGRHDATSSLQHVLATVICSICREHRDILGSTLPEITSEKAALIRRGTPVVCARQRRGAAEVIDKQAKKMKAPLVSFGRDFRVVSGVLAVGGSSFDFVGEKVVLSGLSFPLMGKHQLENAALAIAACQALEKQGFCIRQREIRAGLHRTKWKGRLDVLSSRPLTIVDTACSPAALKATMDFLAHAWPGKRWHVVFALMKDKDLTGMIRILARQAAAVYVVPAGEDRSRDPGAVCRAMRNRGLDSRPFKKIEVGMRQAKKSAGVGGGVLVTGSLFLVGEVMRQVKEL